MFALADCNNFYASCERAFNPKLIGRPVVVLSNNDGCVIARSNEAKALGIEMGTPYHLNEKQFRKQGVHWCSSNYTLYGNMSARVTAVLRQFTPTLEVYSIDEQFLCLNGFPMANLVNYCRGAKQRTYEWTAIPISIGIGPTKTLAKIANRFAKKNGDTGGVFALTDPAEQERVLAALDLEDIWGVARRLSTSLKKLGIQNALDLRNADPQFLRDNFNVVVQRICMELRGISCLPLEMLQPEKKSIMCSRSFGHYITDLEKMRQAVSTYACRGSEKVRAQGLVTNQLVVFLQTNNFNPKHPQYFPSKAVTLTVATSDSRRIVRAAMRGLDQIWRDGFQYKKAGILFNNLHKPEETQLNMFLEPDDPKSNKLMQALDQLNRDFGRNTVALATSGIKPSWSLRANFHSPRYTTQWNELFTALAK